jgi:DNA-3-methyladenine glycosylase
MPLKVPKFHPLPRSFFEPGAAEVAPKLLGHWLVHENVGGIIVETEAYVRDDPSCHAFRGKTKRNQAMWGEPGRAYVYLIYGFHFCFNTVCRPCGEAEAVLIRALHPLWGLEKMHQRRGKVIERHLASGPGKLCAALGINIAQDGADLCDKAGALIVARNPRVQETLSELGPVVQTTRIGISQAADWPLRWYLRGSPHISRK